MASGWAIKVTINTHKGPPCRQIFYAHIADKEMAEEAVKSHIPDTSDVKLEAVKTLAHKSLVEEKIAEGDVKRWM
jgi:hypothetical protein